MLEMSHSEHRILPTNKTIFSRYSVLSIQQIILQQYEHTYVSSGVCFNLWSSNTSLQRSRGEKRDRETRGNVSSLVVLLAMCALIYIVAFGLIVWLNVHLQLNHEPGSPSNPDTALTSRGWLTSATTAAQSLTPWTATPTPRPTRFKTTAMMSSLSIKPVTKWVCWDDK